MVEYLVTVRKGQLSKVGSASSGFYGGLALGRLLLAEATYRLGERQMLLLYSVLCLGLQLVFWKVTNIIADAVAASCMGFLLGPYFATVKSHSEQRLLYPVQRYSRLTKGLCRTGH
jgi:fucose permease